MTLPGADETDHCRMLDDERLWTVIDQNSQLSVPYAITDPRPNLRDLPYPFGQDSGHSKTLYVLPEGYDLAYSNAVVQLAAQLGAAVKNDHLSAKVSLASKVERKSLEDYHLILLGRPTQNLLLRQFNDSLPWSFVQGSDELTRTSDGDPGLELQLDDSATVGLIQIAQSPWDETHTMLALTGTTDAGAQLAVQTLLDPEQDLRGNLAVVESLSPTGNNPRLQVTDTRPAQPDTPDTPDTPEDGETKDTPAIPPISGPDMLLLAEGWWK
jgi:hypothetical protein